MPLGISPDEELGGSIRLRGADSLKAIWKRVMGTAVATAPEPAPAEEVIPPEVQAMTQEQRDDMERHRRLVLQDNRLLKHFLVHYPHQLEAMRKFFPDAQLPRQIRY